MLSPDEGVVELLLDLYGVPMRLGLLALRSTEVWGEKVVCTDLGASEARSGGASKDGRDVRHSTMSVRSASFLTFLASRFWVLPVVV